MNSPEIESMTCDWCGKQFPADASACVEAGMSANHPPEDGDEWKGEDVVALKPEEFAPDQWEEMKVQTGLDDDQLKELLETGKVEGLGSIVCLDCQDNANQLDPE